MQHSPYPDWLEAAKRLRPLSYRKIAERLGVTHQHVYYWLKVRNGGDPFVCRGCGGQFYRDRNNRSQRFCSHACQGKVIGAPSRLPGAADKIRAAKLGARNAGYRHGRDIGRQNRATDRAFNLALKGEDVCRNCGGSQNLGLHHVIPRSLYRAGLRELLNGVPLCTWCHLGWHRRKVTLYRDIFTPEEWAWLSSAQLTGQMIEPWLDERYPGRGLPFRQAHRRVA